MANSLKSKSARASLEPRRAPYWVGIRIGLHLGYRRAEEGDGTWLGRQLKPGSKTYLNRSFGALPGYDDALAALNAWASGIAVGATHRPTLLEDACKAYVKRQRTRRSAANGADAEGRFKRLVYGQPIGAIPLDRLRTSHVNDWLNEQLDEDGDDEDLRRSKDTANRNLTALKAALNLALRDRLVPTDAAWKTVTRFPNAGRRRERFLSMEDRTALLDHCEPDLAALAATLLLTGARPGEIAGCDVGDFDRKHGTLALTGKTGSRVVTLSTTAVEYLAEHAKGKLPSAPLLTDAFGHRWNKDGWKKRFKATVRAAKLPGDVVLYTLRHVAISEMIAGGVDTFLVAKLAGTSTAMIDKHYGHLRHAQTRARLDAVAMM